MNEPNQSSLQSISIPVAIMVAGALIAGGIYFSGRGNQAAVVNNANTATVFNANNIKPISTADHVLGNPKADIVIIEYSDIECPFCKQFHATLHQLMNEYGTQGKLAWVYRHFPVHTNSIKEGEAVECAAEIGGNDAFWKYTDKIFEITTSNNGLDLAELPVIAEEIGLDVVRFNACLSSEKYKSKIEKDRADVTAAGAQGTPYSVIFTKGDRIPLNQGALPYNDMKTIIDTILKN
ncbi:MAG: thioredoxin domain-containing protein [Patescibacteria group bacterium]